MNDADRSRAARKAGAWAAVTFIGVVAGVGLLIGIMWFVCSEIEFSERLKAEAAAAKADAAVSPTVRADARGYVVAWAAELNASHATESAFNSAKRVTDEASDRFVNDAHTRAERNIWTGVTAGRLAYESCVDESRFTFHFRKLSECESLAPLDLVKKNSGIQ